MIKSDEPTYLSIIHYEKEDITLELIEECYRYSAYIVEQFGEAYLPIFIRLRDEIEARKEKEKIRILMSSLARECHTNCTQNVTHF